MLSGVRKGDLGPSSGPLRIGRLPASGSVSSPPAVCDVRITRQGARPGSCGPGCTIVWLKRDFKCARKALWTERQFGPAELTLEYRLYEVRAEALLLWRTNLRTAALLPNEFHSVSLTLPLPRDDHAPDAI